MNRDKTIGGLQRWQLALEKDGSDSATGAIRYQCGNSAYVSVAEVGCIEVDYSSGDPEPLLCERIKDAILIANAPELLCAVRRAASALRDLVDGISPEVTRQPWEPSATRIAELAAMLNTEANHSLWVRMCEIMDELDRAEQVATDPDNWTEA